MAGYDSSFGGVFEKYVPSIWPFQYEATLLFRDIAGGTPSDSKVAEGWIKSKVKDVTKEDRIRQAVAELMLTKSISEDEAVLELNSQRNCNGFRRDQVTGQLFIEGRHGKAALKEAVSVAVAAGNLEAKKWGKTNKGAISFAAEHIQVLSEQIFLFWEDGSAVKEPSNVLQTFPVNPITRQTGIQYTEVCEDVRAVMVVTTDMEYTEAQWAAIWVTGGLQGMGASRSQDHGRYQVEKWERLSVK